MRRRSMIGIATIAACVAVACSPSDSGPATTTSTVADTITTSAQIEDGVLQLGVLLPLSGAGTEIGGSMRDAVELAVDEINRSGGVNGRDISLFVADEGDTAATALGSLEKLIADDVDAIVGPASSLIALQVLPITTAADVLTCSPTASAMSLDGYPDDGLFLRTIPSDALQAKAIARVIEQTGKPTAAIVFIDDAFGRPFADQVSNELGQRAISVPTIVGFDPADTDYSDQADAILATGASVVAVVGDASSGPRMVEALYDRAGDDAGLEVIINDAMRVPAIASTYARLADADRALLSGVSPQSRISNETLRERFMSAYPDSRGLFATYAYDCVNLIALAANASNSTRPTTMAQRVPSIADVGTPCITFEACDMGLRAERNINYDGPSGVLQMGVDGDPTRGVFDVFAFDDSGADVLESTIVVAL